MPNLEDGKKEENRNPCREKKALCNRRQAVVLMKRILFLAIVLLCISSAAFAATRLVPNGSFETGAYSWAGVTDWQNGTGSYLMEIQTDWSTDGSQSAGQDLSRGAATTYYQICLAGDTNNVNFSGIACTACLAASQAAQTKTITTASSAYDGNALRIRLVPYADALDCSGGGGSPKNYIVHDSEVIYNGDEITLDINSFQFNANIIRFRLDNIRGSPIHVTLTNEITEPSEPVVALNSFTISNKVWDGSSYINNADCNISFDGGPFQNMPYSGGAYTYTNSGVIAGDYRRKISA